VNQADILYIARQAIYVTIKLGAPIMLLTLVVGLAVSVFQALTQIQEQTLTFIPKIIVTFVAIMFLLPYMTNTLIGFTHTLVDRIINIQ
jgi:flagellar biosynthetic protein FliQ